MNGLGMRSTKNSHSVSEIIFRSVSFSGLMRTIPTKIWRSGVRSLIPMSQRRPLPRLFSLYQQDTMRFEEAFL